MKPTIRINFAFFWDGFTFEIFKQQFPAVFSKYNLILAERPEVVFFGAYSAGAYEHLRDGRFVILMPRISRAALAQVYGNPDAVRVFITGENVEPDMDQCDFAITFSALTDHPNHFRLPLWVWDLRRIGVEPHALVKRPDTDWERMAREKTGFCNFIYSHDVAFRNATFTHLNQYRRVDAAGRCMNNMGGATVPGGMMGKIDFIRRYKFTLAVENAIWPGYSTEKLVEPMVAGSIPIYVGDPNVGNDFNSASFINFSQFNTMKEMKEFVRHIDNDQEEYIDMLSQPFFQDNRAPHYADDKMILSFFDRIFDDAARRARITQR